ncbi:hypothetical protein RhiirC2_781538 [Rhizophagus irregularis]|uniref:Uncharacterized protein n=1 Tax=Rhizophagus irregularis TaxID=588596 RepID=A0A2N1N599_9GLOM|nr:hypothetical protein RhiirC2_781538 [Rhizophagus irregularis]
MSSDPSFEEVKEYNIEQLITYLRTKILNFEENDFAIFRNQRINSQTIVNMTPKEFSEPPFNFVYGKAKNFSNLIDELKSQSCPIDGRSPPKSDINQSSIRLPS